MPSEKPPTFLFATDVDAGEFEHFVDSGSLDLVRRREGAEVVSRRATWVHGLGVEQGTDLA
jgi:hypothetical protein